MDTNTIQRMKSLGWVVIDFDTWREDWYDEEKATRLEFLRLFDDISILISEDESQHRRTIVIFDPSIFISHFLKFTEDKQEREYLEAEGYFLVTADEMGQYGFLYYLKKKKIAFPPELDIEGTEWRWVLLSHLQWQTGIPAARLVHWYGALGRKSHECQDDVGGVFEYATYLRQEKTLHMSTSGIWTLWSLIKLWEDTPEVWSPGMIVVPAGWARDVIAMLKLGVKRVWMVKAHVPNLPTLRIGNDISSEQKELEKKLGGRICAAPRKSKAGEYFFIVGR